MGSKARGPGIADILADRNIVGGFTDPEEIRAGTLAFA